MRAWKLAALAAAMLALTATRECGAITHADGTTVTGRDGDGIVVIDGTKWRVVRGTAQGGGGLNVTLVDPDREFLLEPITKIYYDTLSTNGRTRDSLLVPMDVHNLSSVTFAVKLEGAATDGSYRIALGVRVHPGFVSDSSTTWSLPAKYIRTGAITDIGKNVPDGSLPDSIGVMGGLEGSATVAYPHETLLWWSSNGGTTAGVGWPGNWILVEVRVPSGVRGMSFTMRVLSGATAAGNPFRIRVDAVGRAL